MVAVVRCVPAAEPGIPGCRRCGSGASSAVGYDHRSTGYQGNSDRGRLLPATPCTGASQHHPSRFTPHPISSEMLSRPSRGSSYRVVSCSDIRCRDGRPAAHPAPLNRYGTVCCTTTPRPSPSKRPRRGRHGRSTGDARGRAHRGLRTHRRHADRCPGLPGRHGGLAVPAPLRFARRLRGTAGHRGTRLLAAESGAAGGHRTAPGGPAALPRRLPDPGIGVGHAARHRTGDRFHAAA